MKAFSIQLFPGNSAAILACLAVTIAGCANPTLGADPEDARDECVTCEDAKSDAFGIEELSYEALGLRDVVNTLSEEQLDRDVGLYAVSAAEIIARRPFESLSAIDEVPYIGAVSFSRILDYARLHGFIGSCGDGELQSEIEGCDPGLDVDCSTTCSVGASCGDLTYTSELPVWSPGPEEVRWNAVTAETGPADAGGLLIHEDPVHGHVVAIDHDGITWSYNGSEWRELATAAAGPPAADPSTSAAALAYDPVRRRLVFFGGRAGETWEWDGAVWNRAMAGSGPRPRIGGRMAFDPRSEEILLFGGKLHDDEPTHDFWSWDGVRWQALDSTDLPPPRCFHAMAFDENTGELVVHGGRQSLTPDILTEVEERTAFDDTWTWNGTHWTRRSHNLVPVLNHAPVASAVWNPARRRIAMRHSHDGRLLEWDGERWQRRSVSYTSTVRQAFMLAFDTSRNVMIAVDVNPRDQIWELNTTAAPNQAPHLSLPEIVSARAGARLELRLRGGDSDGDDVVYGYSALPAGATYDNRGLLTWEPTALQIGDHDVVLGISDGRSCATDRMVIRVVPADHTDLPLGNYDGTSLSARFPVHQEIWCHGSQRFADVGGVQLRCEFSGDNPGALSTECLLSVDYIAQPCGVTGPTDWETFERRFTAAVRLDGSFCAVEREGTETPFYARGVLQVSSDGELELDGGQTIVDVPNGKITNTVIEGVPLVCD